MEARLLRLLLPGRTSEDGPRAAGARNSPRKAQMRLMNRLRSKSRLLLFCLATLSCDIPRDPEHTLASVQEGGRLLVGATEAPPHLTRHGDGASGPEADLVLAFARRVDATVEWRWGSVDEHLRALEEFRLHLVAAGLEEASPWSSRVGFTRPWRIEKDQRRVLAVPPGENRMLLELNAVIIAEAGGRREAP